MLRASHSNLGPLGVDWCGIYRILVHLQDCYTTPLVVALPLFENNVRSNEGMLTLFMSITGGIDWQIAYEPLREVSWVAQSLMNLYIVIGFLHNTQRCNGCVAWLDSSDKHGIIDILQIM